MKFALLVADLHSADRHAYETAWYEDHRHDGEPTRFKRLLHWFDRLWYGPSY